MKIKALSVSTLVWLGVAQRSQAAGEAQPLHLRGQQSARFRQPMQRQEAPCSA